MANPTTAMRPAAALVKAVGIEAGFAIDDTVECFTERGPMKGMGETSIEVEATWGSASSDVVVVVVVVVDDAVIAAVGNGVIGSDEVDVAHGKDGVDGVDGVNGTVDVVIVMISIGASVSKGTSAW
ncbi:hypothetical protein TGAMA5MH_05737 [Trichoderma gamsii]|uniref:Uncharacterized protein n=1 Tax=Trichoderma gamsii TaxID=398673 RepID=A0A2K0TBU9_9HYPO|nr:hypothetical protein TGAMA5MH_05737 [Trichoderma gamsii]